MEKIAAISKILSDLLGYNVEIRISIKNDKCRVSACGNNKVCFHGDSDSAAEVPSLMIKVAGDYIDDMQNKHKDKVSSIENEIAIKRRELQDEHLLATRLDLAVKNLGEI